MTAPLDVATVLERAKHTRSPWFWARDKINQRTNLMRSGTGDYVLSPQADIGDYSLSIDYWTDISDADAALIEAAPDLLEALTVAMDVLKMMVHPDAIHSTSVMDAFTQAVAAETKARTAIAKARGAAS